MFDRRWYEYNDTCVEEIGTFFSLFMLEFISYGQHSFFFFFINLITSEILKNVKN